MKNRAHIFILLIILVLVLYGVWYSFSGQYVKVYMLDVGQGDAFLIEAPNRKQMLIDSGPNRGVLRGLGARMPFWDRTIDILVATHPDQDHIGGLPEVLKRYRVKLIIDPCVASDTAVYREYQRLVAEEIEGGATYLCAKRGMVVALDDAVTFSIYSPDRQLHDGAGNNASIIGQLVYGESEVLFTGDAPKAIEDYLVSLFGERLQSDVLKVSHHGSKTSTGDLFLEAVDPHSALISVGEENRYGHPHVEVINRLEEYGATVLYSYNRKQDELRLGLDGAIRWK